MMKKQLCPSDSSNFPPLLWRIPQILWTVTQTFTCISYVLCAKTTFHRLTSRKHGQWEGWRHKTATISVTLFRPVIFCRIKHNSVPLAIYKCRRIVLKWAIIPVFSRYCVQLKYLWTHRDVCQTMFILLHYTLSFEPEHGKTCKITWALSQD